MFCRNYTGVGLPDNEGGLASSKFLYNPMPSPTGYGGFACYTKFPNVDAVLGLAGMTTLVEALKVRTSNVCCRVDSSCHDTLQILSLRVAGVCNVVRQMQFILL